MPTSLTVVHFAREAGEGRGINLGAEMTGDDDCLSHFTNRKGGRRRRVTVDPLHHHRDECGGGGDELRRGIGWRMASMTIEWRVTDSQRDRRTNGTAAGATASKYGEHLPLSNGSRRFGHNLKRIFALKSLSAGEHKRLSPSAVS